MESQGLYFAVPVGYLNFVSEPFVNMFVIPYMQSYKGYCSSQVDFSILDTSCPLSMQFVINRH